MPSRGIGTPIKATETKGTALESAFAMPARTQPVTQPTPLKQELEVKPVQSSLPPMQQAPQQMVAAHQSLPIQQQFDKRPKLGVGYQQRAAALSDPRFAQALTQKFQQDIAAQQAELTKQQQVFQQEFQKSGYLGGLASAQTRINDIMSKISSGTATDADLAEYQKLQNLQYTGPQGLQSQANIAALTQLASSPALLAQQYSAVAPGALTGQQIGQSLVGLGGASGLEGARQAAGALQQQQQMAQSATEQQAGLAQQEFKSIQEQAKKRAESEKSKLIQELSGSGQTDVLQKTQALDKLKEGLFLTGKISPDTLKKLGLTQSDLSGLKGIDVSQIEGLKSGASSSAKGLKDAVQDLKDRQTKGEVLTPEQQRLVDVYGSMESLARKEDISSAYGAASKTDLAKINALRRLTGEAPLTESDIGKGLKSGKLAKEDITTLIGQISGQTGKYAGQEEAETTLKGKQDRLTGNLWYKGGLTQAKTDLSPLDPNRRSHIGQFFQVANSMLQSMQASGTKKNNLWHMLIDDGVYSKLRKAAERNPTAAEITEAMDAAKTFMDAVNANYSEYQGAVSTQQDTLGGMSGIYKDLIFG